MSANEAGCRPASTFGRIEADLPLIKWMMGFVLTFQVAIFAKLLMR